jgi:hypothetical protein
MPESSFIAALGSPTHLSAAAEVIPVQSGVEGLNGADRGSGGTTSRPVRRMVVQSNS